MPPPTKTVAGRVRFAEAAGGATAECAAVCCCGPCIVIDILVLAIYKVPAGLYRRALRRKRRRRQQRMKKKKGGVPARRGRCCPAEYEERDIEILSGGRNLYSSGPKCQNSDEKAMELEKEMWDIFCNTGFWRSPSQRGDQISNCKRI